MERARKWFFLLSIKYFLVIMTPVLFMSQNAIPFQSAVANAPLSVNTENPRYFSDGSGKIVYLTGSHTWFNLQDTGISDPPPPFHYGQWLDFLQSLNHNFFRLWIWEETRWLHDYRGNFYFTPHPFRRTGPGLALDGKPKFDLTKFDQAFFNRLRQRVIDAGRRGIYVSIMLFNGFSVEKHKEESSVRNPWRGHPFHRYNNINGIDGDSNNDESGAETHTLEIPAITSIQEKYVAKVIDTVNDLNNVLYEISNESHRGSTKWQYHMIRYIKEYESRKPKRHPVGMTAEWPGGKNSDLFTSPADWISPGMETTEDYLNDPSPADGSKVLLLDTDHLCGICGDRKWVWKSFLRGSNPIFMDIYNGRGPGVRPYDMNNPNDVSLRKNLGYTRSYAKRIRMSAMTPRGDLSSSGYCLANPSASVAEYLVYIQDGGKVIVDLSSSSGPLSVEWFDPKSGMIYPSDSIMAGGFRSFIPPFQGDAVLYIFGKKAIPFRTSHRKTLSWLTGTTGQRNRISMP